MSGIRRISLVKAALAGACFAPVLFLLVAACAPPAELRAKTPEAVVSQQATTGAQSAEASARNLPVAPRVGFLSPAFSLKTLDDKVISLAEFKGKPVILNFWATWCAPCRDEMPLLQQLHDQKAKEGLVVIGINSGETGRIIDRYVDQLSLTFTVVTDREKEATNAYGIVGLPTTFFIDREGVVRSVRVGAYSSLQELLTSVRVITERP